MIDNAIKKRKKLLFYIHPYDINPNHPNIPLISRRRYRRMYNLHKFHIFFNSLLQNISFTSIEKGLVKK
jgi:hypothetical protein